MLGRCNRVHIPLCVVEFIRSICPSNDGRYTGHQAVEGGDVDNDETEEDDEPEAEEDDTVNTSYEEFEEEASPKLANFNDGEKFDCA